MATVTIGKSYFDALLRSLSNNVTISKAEHDYLVQAVREYNLLKNALFRGGLTAETLDTLLSGQSGAMHEEPASTPYNINAWEETFVKPHSILVTITVPHSSDLSPDSENTAVGEGLQPRAQHSSGRVPNRTTHKDLAGIIRGGRLLDLFLRNDQSAAVSFVEGAQDFLTYTKRNDICLHTKWLEFRWNDRQFHVPPHVSNKIAGGATRNIIVRGAAGKLNTDQIRDHLDHIHNLVVVDIKFKNGDAYISTNSIHNALFARTYMMSRTAYKGLRIEWYPDECAAPLPKPSLRAQTLAQAIPAKPVSITNRYTLLDIDGTDADSDEDEE
ncbi:hypothetical protein K469DRAFT_732964 [Zopfia rhizophila CBS 207.26]|uniref:Uncharacterized protein n=1 Tax=Zopfia rhizophila CBS 207.26 TaxID=1314779 RepID=A0A6A6DE79_9PEZI|nr:hypothetical protein K469DRAFT_732964 [Zopfia rhizophila CBS 207.26]